MLINDVLHENLTIPMLDELLAKLPADPGQYKDPTVTWKDGALT